MLTHSETGSVGPPSIERRLLSFWPLQLGGWAGYAAANMAALIPSRHAQDYVVYRSMYLTVTFLGSFVMYPICRWLRRSTSSLIRSILACVVLGYLLAVPASVAITWAEIHFGNARNALHWQTVLANAVGVAFVYVAWSGFYFGIKHYQDAEENKARLQVSEALAREAQLRALRYQIQPHFLFNTLNAISSLVRTDKPRQATQMIARLGDLLRMTLDSPQTHEVPLDEELEITEEYLSIEQVRFGPGLRVSYCISPDVLAKLVPRFLLQPLVENAVRHGISQRTEGGEITISAEAKGANLEIVVENETGSHYVHKQDTSHFEGTGLGLANTRLRLRQLYGERANVRTETTASSRFRVTIVLPAARSERADDSPRVSA